MTSKRKRQGRVPGIRVEPKGTKKTCAECRLHRARLNDEQRARYRPPLGVKFLVRVESGGTVALCPRCDHVGSGEERATLLERGILTQRQASKVVIRGA